MCPSVHGDLLRLVADVLVRTVEVLPTTCGFLACRDSIHLNHQAGNSRQ